MEIFGMVVMNLGIGLTLIFLILLAYVFAIKLRDKESISGALVRQIADQDKELNKLRERDRQGLTTMCIIEKLEKEIWELRSQLSRPKPKFEIGQKVVDILTGKIGIVLMKTWTVGKVWTYTTRNGIYGEMEIESKK
jgi:hypothetical protein